MLAGLTQHQLLVFLAVMRKTYGFNKKLDWVSNEQLSELTGILPHKCSAAKSVLVMKWFTEFGHLNRGDMLTSEQHRCHNEKKKFQRRV